MDQVTTQNAPAAVGPYSQAIVSGGTVYVSGQLGVDENGVIAGDVAVQTENALKNLSQILLAAGSNLSRVVKTTCFLANINDFAAFNKVYGDFFPQKPARSLIEASALPKGSLIEIEAIAELAAPEKLL